MNRRVAASLLVAVVVIVAVISSVAVLQRGDAQHRIDLARDVAIRAVSACGTGEAPEISDAWGRHVSAREASRLKSLIPVRVLVDSRSFTTPFWNPISATASTVEVQHPADPGFAALVTLRWADTRQNWVVSSIRGVSPK